MSERKRTLAKLTVGSDDELYLLTTAIGEDGEEGFELALCDGVNGWTGSCIHYFSCSNMYHKITGTQSTFISVFLKKITEKLFSF